MPDITTLRNTYFVNRADEDLPSEPVPATYDGCQITPLIGPDSFFSEFRRVIERTTGGSEPGSEEEARFIYLANWSLELGGASPFTLDGESGSNRLRDVLVQKAHAGVDVRVLAWVSATVMTDRLGRAIAGRVESWNLPTIESIRLLRQEPELRYKACLNTNHHPAGSAHLKMAIVHDGETCVGFTGGLDFIQSRYGWRDVQAKIEGPVVQDLYDYFREIWNELISVSHRPMEFNVDGHSVYSYISNASDRPPIVLVRDVGSISSSGTHHVQSLRTVPNAPPAGLFLLSHSLRSSATQGISNVKTALRKAILAAQTYIYIEDQYFWCGEIMSWINEAVIVHDELKVILLSHDFDTYAQYAISHNLFHNPDLTIQERERIAIFQLGRATEHDEGTCADYRLVHSKTTLIDDQWAIIGSANCTRRSLYTDFEHAISMLDEAESESLVQQYRIDLWYEYFCGRNIEDIQQALYAWNTSWGQEISGGPFFPTHLVRYSLPSDLPSFSQYRYDHFVDPDSRAWRGFI